MKMTKKEKNKEESYDHAYNQGRLEGDRKWIDEINERITELEIKVGIPELRRIRDKTRYRWKKED